MSTNEIGRVARSLLEDQLDELVDLSMTRLIDDEEGYKSINLADLRDQMERTLSLALMRLGGIPIPAELSSAAYETGQLRAYQNLDLSSVLHSFRIDLRILWEAILREGRAADLDSAPRFLEGLVDVWEAVEANTEDVVEGYRRAADRLSRRVDEIRSVAFENLLLDGERNDAILADVSRSLDFPIESQYLCLVGAFSTPVPEVLNRCLARLNQRNIRSHFSWGANELIGVIMTNNLSADVLEYLDELKQFSCGVFDVQGLKAVPRGIRLARSVIRGSDILGIHDLRKNWTAACASVDSELSDSLVGEVLAPIESLPSLEREACFETIGAWIASDGTIADISKITYRHRNTIRKRIGQVETLTGLSLTRPIDVATMNLAYAAHKRS